MCKVTSIQVWEADRSGVVAAPEGIDLRSQLDGPMLVTERLGEAPKLKLTLITGCPAVVTVEGDSRPYLRARRILRRVFDDASFEEYRILDSVRETSGEQQPSVEGERIWADLGGSTPRRVLTSGYADHTLFLNNRTAQEALDELISSDLDAPGLFAAGTVDATLASKIIHLQFDGGQSHLDGLRQMTEQLRRQTGNGEVEFVYNGGTGKYDVNIVKEVGWTAAERIAGTPDPTKRPIELGGSTAGTRRSLQRRSESRKYFSRIVPLGGGAEETVTIGQAIWAAAAGSGGSTITLYDEPIWADDVLIGSYWGNDTDGWREITDSAAPSQITLASAWTGTKGRFALNADGDELTFLPSPDETAAGRYDLRKRYAGAAPYDNILDTEGVSADLSEFSGGVPVGTVAVGSAVITQETGSLFVKHGPKSAKVACDAGEGIETVDIPLDPTEEQPWHSAWVHLYVEQGQVELQLVDSAGTIHPVEQVANSSVKNLVAIVIAGMDPVAGNAQLRVIATEATTVFYLDAWTLTRSASAYAYAPLMGPKAIWTEATLQLIDDGGLLPDAYEGETFDIEALEGGSFETIEVGSHVSVRDAWDGSTFGIDFTTRVVEMVTRESLINGPYLKQVQLSRLRKDFRNRFAPGPPDPKLPRVPRRVRVDSTRYPTFQLDFDQTGSTVDITLTFDDPAGVLTQLEWRKAEGRNLSTGDAYSVDTEDSPGVYTYDVDLVEGHDSFVQFRYTLSDGTVITSEPINFDPDNIPGTVFNYEATFNPTSGKYEIYMVWQGREDTKSVFLKMSSPIVTQVFKNGRQGRHLIYNLVDPGASVTLVAKGYSEISGGGNESPELWVTTFTVPKRGPLDNVTWELDFNQVGATVTTTLTIGDPEGLLTEVAWRKAEGRNIDNSDSWTVDTEDSPGVYTYDVGLVEGHQSFVQFRYTLGDGRVITSMPIPFDKDEIPNTVFAHEAIYDSSTGEYDIYVAWQGNEDTKSVRLFMDEPSTRTETHNGRLGREFISSEAPGDNVELRGVGYSGLNQTGNASDEWQVDFDLPDKAPAVDVGDIIGDIPWGVIVGAAPTFSTTGGRFYTNDHNNLRWESMTLYYNGESHAISSGSAALSSSSVPVFIYFDPDSPTSDFQATTTPAVAIDGRRFVVCIGWRSSNSGYNATYTPVVGSTDTPPVASYDQLITNSLNAIVASIANLSALNVNTGNLTVDGLLLMAFDSAIRNAGTDYLIDAGGIRIRGGSSDARQLRFGDSDVTPVMRMFGSSDRAAILAEDRLNIAANAEPILISGGAFGHKIVFDEYDGFSGEDGFLVLDPGGNGVKVAGRSRFDEQLDVALENSPGRPATGYGRLFVANTHNAGIVPPGEDPVRWFMGTDNAIATSGYSTTATRWVRVNIGGTWIRLLAVLD